MPERPAGCRLVPPRTRLTNQNGVDACDHAATDHLCRIDMEDPEGLEFCESCALDSGVFALADGEAVD